MTATNDTTDNAQPPAGPHQHQPGHPPGTSGDRVISRVIEDEMKTSYLAYSMSVIAGRALPDVRDGLKPVQRRVLYAMGELGLVHNKPFKKCARIVGDVLGKYHPHGDMAVYDALVRMAQDFSLRYPLIDGQGNFGSVDGDFAAAMRYTEARLKHLSEELLADIEKETVKFGPNFDGSLKEPLVLPAMAPNLLINGSAGIAVGMATNIPPHNLREVCTAATLLIDNPDATTADLVRIVPGPDFPTGGTVIGTDGIKSAYDVGRGKITVRGTVETEEAKNRTKLIITEIPYMVNKAELITQIADLVNDKKIPGISDIRDESDREGMRVVIDLKIGANAEVTLNQIYQHSRLQETFSIINLALVDNQPKTLGIKDLLTHYLAHRKDIVRRRTAFDLRVAEQKAHILEGLLIALQHIDAVIALIKGAKDPAVAKTGLIQDYKLSTEQAQAILEMRLSRLTGLEQEKIKSDHKDLLALIEDLKDILSKQSRINDIIKQELAMLSERYGDERRTRISLDAAVTLEQEALIKPEEVVVTLSHAGYVKRLPVDAYRAQRRGGKGITGAGTKTEDFIQDLFVANTHDTILLFTNSGKVHWLQVHQVPEAGRYAKGTALANLITLADGEKVQSFVPIKGYDENSFVFFVTAQGTVKKTTLGEFSNPRRGGIMAITLDAGDALVGAELTDGKKNIVIATRDGMAIRFDESDVRPMGRAAGGVRGIKLRETDRVVGIVATAEGKTLLTVTDKGYGKQTPVSEYRMTGRGGVGVINIKVTDKNGRVVTIAAVDQTDEVMLISKSGIMLRTKVSGISEVGRAAQGVRIMRLEDDDSLVSIALVKEDEESDGAQQPAPSA